MALGHCDECGMPLPAHSDICREPARIQRRRLDELMTRREILAAIESVAHQYGMNDDHDSYLICDAFQALAEALR